MARFCNAGRTHSPSLLGCSVPGGAAPQTAALHQLGRGPSARSHLKNIFLKKIFLRLFGCIWAHPVGRKPKENSGIKASGVSRSRFQQRTEAMKGLIVAALILGLSAAVRGALPWYQLPHRASAVFS
jgi:hypothetical protein